MAMIKRYSNRKLYNTQTKRYIKLEDVADLIRRGEDVQVTDHETGADITALIQAQTILELEKRLKGGLPGTVLNTLIRAGSDTLSQLREVLAPEVTNARVDTEIERRVLSLVDQGKLGEKEGIRLLGLLSDGSTSPAPASSPLAGEALEQAIRARGIPSREDWQAILKQLDRLNAEMEELTPPRKRRLTTRRRAKTTRSK